MKPIRWRKILSGGCYVRDWWQATAGPFTLDVCIATGVFRHPLRCSFFVDDPDYPCLTFDFSKKEGVAKAKKQLVKRFRKFIEPLRDYLSDPLKDMY